MNASFWSGFFKEAGAISEALDRVGLNSPRVRSALAKQIKKNRSALHGGKHELEAFAGDTNHGLLIDHGAHGSPSRVVEKTPGTRAKLVKLKSA